MFLFCSDEPPMVTNQPKSLSKVCPGTAVVFAVQATGTEPLSYLWQWKPAEEEGGSEEWQPCPAEWSEGATLTIPSVQKSNEGSYCCVISNYAGTQTSNSAKLSVGKNPLKLISTVEHGGHILCSFSTIHVADPPRITTHPRELKDVAPGKCAMFSVEATGTEPLSCKWEWNPAEDSSGTDEWQPCDLENFPGTDSSTLKIPCVQKYNKGSYRCIISNCAGSQLSKAAQLSVGKFFFIIHA